MTEHDPWRTRADYLKEQRRENVRYWSQIVVSIATVITMFAAVGTMIAFADSAAENIAKLVDAMKETP